MDEAGFYDVVRRRRDMRGEFPGAPVPTEVLDRILGAAHTAPSVGLSQPWDFVLIRDMDTRTALRDHVQAERKIIASQLDQEQASTFARIKVEGGLESSRDCCVVRSRGQARSLIPVGQIAKASSSKAARTRRFAPSSVPSS